MSEGCSPHHYFSLSFQPDCTHALFLTPPLFYSALFFHHHLSPKSLLSLLCYLLETYPFPLAPFLINPLHYFLKDLLCLHLFHCPCLCHPSPAPLDGNTTHQSRSSPVPVAQHNCAAALPFTALPVFTCPTLLVPLTPGDGNERASFSFSQGDKM